MRWTYLVLCLDCFARVCFRATYVNLLPGPVLNEFHPSSCCLPVLTAKTVLALACLAFGAGTTNTKSSTKFLTLCLGTTSLPTSPPNTPIRLKGTWYNNYFYQPLRFPLNVIISHTDRAIKSRNSLSRALEMQFLELKSWKFAYIYSSNKHKSTTNLFFQLFQPHNGVQGHPGGHL